ncbi:hypothetical protein HPB52_011927 [Rhipicephalus sanguineus]|uniref:Uncharacterized protein n=1 Tax=Rhipicephalus sanguineus TaxID=34632 RepID=A0A9D4PZJ9_RHISA|nr:hypothetical protein HPB52_011927 [Rhipicephalus sanguineus]
MDSGSEQERHGEEHDVHHRKRKRKRYLEPGADLVVPRSTLFYQRAPNSATTSGDQQASTVDPLMCSSPTYAEDSRQSESGDTSSSDRDDIAENETAYEDCSRGSPRSVEELLTESADWDAGTGESDEQTAVGEDDFAKLFSHERLPHSDLSVADAMVMLMAYSTSAGLNWSDMEKLVHVINLFLGADVLPSSQYLLRKAP